MNEVTEPVSRKLIHLAKIYLNVLSERLGHLDIDRYWYFLSVIRANDGQLTQKALGDKMGKDKSAVVNIIDNLAERGYVYREINPADRRQHLLRVTEKANREVPEMLTTFDELNALVAGDIPAQELEIFFRVLLQMEDNLKPYATQEMNIKLNLNK
ncbi:winged helix-turn-helix transcriptional regulator [Mucilaginibacter mali]|uniref:Winged helix-turn-helix transcriptional regulator n=1 Tax=Mucilaginibacter mali TaxID=2740462 RepID=A0A7D4Q6T1_9SPHI|nr:MarR family winged helix-turn-helix transcriptional regulator [Mucilaginibacter mali]QKJ32507.1 winged helix-turn-helix transcriptional regulator [Mucilaginibacter mali]